MSPKIIELKLPTDYTEDFLYKKIVQKIRRKDFTYKILKKSLDARKKPDVKWVVRVEVFLSKKENHNLDRSFNSPINQREEYSELDIEYKKRTQKVIIVGSGPAGFFTGYVLALAGFEVKILEQGEKVDQRTKDIENFEQTGELKNHSNYAFGEGGAGTFSDGKLTARTKNIEQAQTFVFENFIVSGAPEEIRYLAHPHVGSDNLRIMVRNLRKKFEAVGGEMVFQTRVTDLILNKKKCCGVKTKDLEYLADYVIFAHGHSDFGTFRMLIDRGVQFCTKPFAIGVRVEHPQALINQAQWGCPKLSGVKAAEYRLTHRAENGLPVYSFCMCPGGTVVPAAPRNGLNIVNGVSNYARNSDFGNAAVVVGGSLSDLLEKEVSVAESLDWLESLEQRSYDIFQNFNAPANDIQSFLNKKVVQKVYNSSYPFDLVLYDFSELLPEKIISALRDGLQGFSQKLKGYEQGIMLGLETKTSAPLQSIRDDMRRCVGFENLYLVGEGSGWAGGIVSSAVDGVKTALALSQL